MVTINPFFRHGMMNLYGGLHRASACLYIPQIRCGSIFVATSTAPSLCLIWPKLLRYPRYCMYQVSLAWQGASCEQHDESYDTFFHLTSGSISLAAVCLLSHKSRLTTWRFFLLSPYCLALSLLSYPAGQNGDRTHTSRSFYAQLLPFHMPLCSGVWCYGQLTSTFRLNGRGVRMACNAATYAFCSLHTTHRPVQRTDWQLKPYTC